MKTNVQIKLLLSVPLLFLCLFDCSVKAQAQVEPLDVSNYKVASRTVNAKLYKSNVNYELKGLEIITGDFPYLSSYEKWKGNSYNGRAVSFRNENLAYFYISNDLSVVLCEDGMSKDGNMIGGCGVLEEGDLLVQMPYFPNGKYADIYDPFGKKVLTIDLSFKATCNENSQCDQPIEDGENCPQDCVKQEPKIDPVLIEKAEKAAVESGSAVNFVKSKRLVFLIAAGIILALAGLGFWLWRRYRSYKDRLQL